MRIALVRHRVQYSPHGGAELKMDRLSPSLSACLGAGSHPVCVDGRIQRREGGRGTDIRPWQTGSPSTLPVRPRHTRLGGASSGMALCSFPLNASPVWKSTGQETESMPNGPPQASPPALGTGFSTACARSTWPTSISSGRCSAPLRFALSSPTRTWGGRRSSAGSAFPRKRSAWSTTGSISLGFHSTGRPMRGSGSGRVSESRTRRRSSSSSDPGSPGRGSGRSPLPRGSWVERGCEPVPCRPGRQGDPSTYVLAAGPASVCSLLFTGPVAEADDLLLGADAFLFPTVYEPFSNACLEAAAAGLPVVTTSVNGAAEVLGKGESGLSSQRPARCLAAL